MVNKMAQRVANYLLAQLSVWMYTGYPLEAAIVAVIHGAYRHGGEALLKSTVDAIRRALEIAVDSIRLCIICRREIDGSKRFCPECGADQSLYPTKEGVIL